MESAPDDDPQTWSIDQVIHELCHNLNPRWSTSAASQLIPDRESLEDTFRQNHVDGDTLLALDMATLKGDLGISSFGQKRAIIRAIEYLRLHSQHYQLSAFTADSIARLQSPSCSTQIPHPRLSFAPQSPVMPGLGTAHALDARSTYSPATSSGGGQTQTSRLQQQALPQADHPFLKPQSLAHQPTSLTNRTAAEIDPHPTPADSTLGTLDFLQANVDAELSLNNSATNDSTASIALVKDDPPTHAKPKRKIAPTLFSQAEAPTDKHSYLSNEPRLPQDTFYHCLSTDWGDHLCRLPDDDAANFYLENQNHPSGRRQIIAAQMKHYLQQPVERLPRSGWLWRIPYGSNHRKSHHKKTTRKSSEQFFTLFPGNGSRPVVCALADFPELKDTVQRKSLHETHTSIALSSDMIVAEAPPKTAESRNEVETSGLEEFAYLLGKYPVTEEEEALPLYGDSGDEGELDEATWKEYEEERVEKQNLSLHMTASEVESTINETLEDYRREWSQTRLPKAQIKAYRLWMISAKQKSRKGALEHSQFWKDHSTNQLRKLKEALLKDVWHKPADVKHQCQSMELTVFSIEDHTYFVQALLSDDPPQRPTRAECLSKPTKRQQPLEDGEELIESDSDVNSDLQDFLDSSSDAGSIHHEPDLDDWSPIIPKKEIISPAVKDKNISEAAQNAVAPNLATTLTADLNDNDADIETDSDDAIVTPNSRRKASPGRIISPRKLTGKQQATPKKKFALPPSPGRRMQLANSDSDSDLNLLSRVPKSKYRQKGDSRISAIDLTMSSPPSAEKKGKETSSEFDVHTPELNPDLNSSPSRKTSRQSSIHSRTSLGYNSVDSSLPPWGDFQGIRNTAWARIERLCDGRRALAKAVYDLKLSTATSLSRLIAPIFHDNPKHDGRELIILGLTGLGRDEDSAIGASLELDHHTLTLALLYMIYCDGQNFLDKVGPSDGHIQNAYKELDAGHRMFFDLLKRLLRIALGKLLEQETATHNEKKRKKQSLSPRLLIDDTDLQMSDGFSTDLAEQVPPPSSKRRRKRIVVQSQEAKSQQKSDQQRIEEQEKRRKVMEQRFAQIETSGNVVSPVNFTEPYVYLDPHIASRVKPHQLKGIQFMWREIIEDPKHQGCILAHTMGLGKTMQVISLLVTIAQCIQSHDPNMTEHIPVPCRNKKTLILCPASLLDNWYDELAMWCPNRNLLGSIHKLDVADDQTVRTWGNSGGILLISYDRFRSMVNKSAQETSDQSNSFKSLEKILLEEPSIVVADEAHMMKNPKSAINQVTKRFKTRSRIALTGSPLNNHLEEYHAMVDWIAPEYLGNITQFRAKYSDPINQGLYAESTAFERRRALKKLHVLKRDLDPKINRADISAVEQDMPSKTDYFITIAVTELQKEAYNTFVRYMSEAVLPGKGFRARLWAWIAILQLLCNHPSCCYDKLRECQRNLLKNPAQVADKMVADKELQSDKSSPETEPQSDKNSPKEDPPDDVVIDIQGSMKEAMEKVLEVFAPITAARELNNADLSYRMSLVRDIVKGAVAIGDKTLIFSHSISTLTYLEKMLREMGCGYIRLDGNTKPSNRQAMTKSFNKDTSYQVFLISTKAGGLGMNLQGANRVIILDFSYNPSWEEQAIGRAYRLGQTRPVFVYRFRAGSTFEEVMFNQAVFKQQVFQRVVDHKNPARHASKDASEWLFPVKETEQKEFDECIGKDPSVLDTIIKRVDYIRNIELTETFQREDDEKLNEEDVKEAEAEFLMERLFRENPEAYYAKQQEEARQQQALRAGNTFRSQYPSRFPGPPVHSPHFQNIQTPASIHGYTRSGPAFGIPSSELSPIPVSRSDMHVSAAPWSEEIARQNKRQTLERTTDDHIQRLEPFAPVSGEGAGS
ncbi:uncharacterized protein A1O9_02687 [Exophiala aquamarina CBS 119918]|uniref:Adenosinetriphosphatase n=1 Tax=Exophiala aquamarina CBS 119918 TaxID=1182545 RepID=A0A072PMY6_9EURO|nr:uncharacterized protein A1O9_02687 [Exophiala aquamarina CBS 119918]KEF61122.1 hypothetical protein A1O9_02687 [Exophiala aquamarina CBS 119918]